LRLVPTNLNRKLISWFSPVLIFLLDCIGRSLRIKSVGYERYQNTAEPLIFCTWHGRLFVGTRFLKGRGLTAMVSQSRDGDVISRLLLRWGYQPIRGSTGREGVKVLVEAIRSLKEGASMAITPDGPRGPARVVQDGLLAMAQKSGAAIVPTSSSAQWRINVSSWDRFLVPLPFSRGVMVFGEPIFVQDIERARSQVQEALDDVQRLADRL